MKIKFAQLKGLPLLLTGLLCAVSLPAQTLTFLTTAPVPTNSDVYSLIGSTVDSLNVNDGGTYADGGANDSFTYLAFNQASKGQTFTTGATAGQVTAIWIRQVGYVDEVPNTYWNFSAGSPLTFRITNPSQVNTPAFAMDSETYTITGTEPNWPGGASSSTTGTGRWIRLGLTNTVTLSPNTQYGFDVTFLSGGGDYFETWGTNGAVYSGGTAYNGSTVGGVDDTMVPLVGDRAFLIEFNGGTFTPPTAPTNAATINFQPYAPTPSANDQYNFTGAANETGNVNNGVTVGDVNNAGDQFTYVANGQPNQGQFFTTGSNPSGYHVAAVWLQHVGYTSNAGQGNGTFYSFAPGGSPTFTFRLTDPSQANTAGFALDTENVNVTGVETNNPSPTPGNSANGTGTWIRFGFSSAGTNIALSPNTRYGFDVMGADGDYFSVLGTSNVVYSGGPAYNGTANGGVPDDTTNLLLGSRAFLVEMVGDNWTLQVAPPSITNQPANTIVPQGANAFFTPVVTGSPTLTYQWYFNTNTILAGQTNATLSIPAVNTNNGVIGGYSVVVANNFGMVTSAVARLAVELPSLTTNITFSGTGGSILDQNGVGTGLNVRLAGTGSAIPMDDPYLLMDTVDGVLDITSPTCDFNGQLAMASAEAIGFNLSSIGFNGTQDFVVTGFMTNAVVGQNYDQAGTFVGTASTNFVRDGIIYNSDFTADPGSYGVGNQNGVDIGIATAATPTGEMAATIARASGVWSLSVNGLNVTPNASLTYLNGPNDLTVGVFALNTSGTANTATVDSISASLFTGPHIQVAKTGSNLTLTWNVVSSGLLSNTNLANPNGWQPVAGATTSPFTTSIPTSGNMFYRIAP